MLSGTDWQRTVGFPLPSDGCGLIRINLAGREPEGIVEPGVAYDRVCADISQSLVELRHADTDEPVVLRVARFDELFGVAPPAALPDLCVQWRRLHPVRAVRSERLGIVEVPSDSPVKAVHTSPGFLIGRAPGIPASGSPSLDGPSARLEDVAPTVMASLGVAPPEELSGRPITALATAVGEAAQPPLPRSTPP
jgi:predicted AlkP superfamily phosphohydrolase/phosphomutase